MDSMSDCLFEVNDETGTMLVAKWIERFCERGTVIALDGDLGAGKTKFTQALALAMGIKGNVNSPTFTIIKEYEGERLPLYHMDVYRIDEDEAAELGLDDYFYGDGVTVVEWASRIISLLPDERIQIQIDRQGVGEQRFIRLRAKRTICDQLQRQWQAVKGER